MTCDWKPNWDETQQHFRSWWQHKGLVLACELFDAAPARDANAWQRPALLANVAARYTDIEWRVRYNHARLACKSAAADSLLIARTDIGPGSLALLLGSEPVFAEETVWFGALTEMDPEKWPPLRFTPDNRWWRLTVETIRASREMAQGHYVVGCPDLIENVDILAALRGPQQLMIDLHDRPDWVLQKIDEITQVWFDAYSRIYDLIRLDDGSALFGAFQLWAPGKVAKVQCDASAMFSPRMFEKFVAPALRRQCAWLDYSMYHLDGPDALRHLDLLLDMDELDAIEWTPGPQAPSGGNLAWVELYRRILAAGKSVQAIDVKAAEVLPLLNAVGSEGVYLLVNCRSEAEMEELARQVWSR